MKALNEWDWPGNGRELANFIERAVTLTRGKSLEVPVTELRKVRLEKPAQTAPGQEEIPQMVKETLNAFARKTNLAGEY